MSVTRMRVSVREGEGLDELHVSRTGEGDLLVLVSEPGCGGTRNEVFIQVPAVKARVVVHGMASIVGLEVPGGHFDEEIRDALDYVIATSKHDTARFEQARLMFEDVELDEAGEVSA
jgi:hypothetical protein